VTQEHQGIIAVSFVQKISPSLCVLKAMSNEKREESDNGQIKMVYILQETCIMSFFVVAVSIMYQEKEGS